MIAITVVLTLLVAVESNCGSLEGKRLIAGYIVGGKPTRIEDVPYQVALLSANLTFECGASLVSPNHVVTAAHCIDSPRLTYNIRAGSSDKTKGGQVAKSKRVVIHPKYNKTTLDYDVAVLELATPVKLTNGSRVIGLGGGEAPDGELVKISGWGCLKENGTRPDRLHSTTVAMVSRMTCEKNYKNHYKITERMVCAAATGKDTCQGDSGGPLAYKGRLTGVVSFGVGCARENFPGVYTNLAHPEITKFVKDNINVRC